MTPLTSASPSKSSASSLSSPVFAVPAFSFVDSGGGCAGYYRRFMVQSLHDLCRQNVHETSAPLGFKHEKQCLSWYILPEGLLGPVSVKISSFSSKRCVSPSISGFYDICCITNIDVSD